MSELTNRLLSFLNESPTAFHAVGNIRRRLLAAGFTELDESSGWSLSRGKGYFAVRNESSLIAFRIPQSEPKGFMIGASHSDSPSFKIKEIPEVRESGYVRLNVEKYGGMIIAPWLDRPLSVAGRILLSSQGRLETRLVNIDEDLCIIPSLAIHMDRRINESHSWQIQSELAPIISEEENFSLLGLIAEKEGIRRDDIAGHDLFLYPREKASYTGPRQEWITSPRLDDLECTFADLEGFLQAEPSSSVPVYAVFDNEETGSLTKQGADSTFLEDVLHRIIPGSEPYLRALSASFLVSADNAHALHPAHPEKADPVNRPKMNKGIVLKYNASQRYGTDAVSSAIFRGICEAAGVPVQVYANRSDIPGGSTLGTIAGAHVSVCTADIGLAQLAMHSCRETAGAKDPDYLAKAMSLFFSSTLENLGQGSWKIR